MFGLATPNPVVCGSCSTEATASLWLIVSMAQPPPPFVSEARHQFHECANCGALTVMVAPLIALNIGGRPPMLLVPMESASEEENREAFNYVLDQVRSGMGDAWRPEYLQQAEVVDREQLRDLWPAA
jgi:hypothetical protein